MWLQTVDEGRRSTEQRKQDESMVSQGGREALSPVWKNEWGSVERNSRMTQERASHANLPKVREPDTALSHKEQR